MSKQVLISPPRIEVVNDNYVKVTLADGRIIDFTSNDSTAFSLADRTLSPVPNMGLSDYMLAFHDNECTKEIKAA